MDRRRTPRHSADVSVAVTLLSADGSADVTLDAQVTDWSAAGMRLRMAVLVKPGTPVRVNWPDQLALGEVCHCAQIDTGCFAVGLRVSQMMGGLESLRRLSDQLMGTARHVRVSHL